MGRNLTLKLAVIIVLVLVSAWTLIPPTKTLKPGLDIAGGTSLVYEINTEGLSQPEIEGLSERMIRVLRRRVDPTNIRNLVWRPQGNTRFEIQMPLASAEALAKRTQYDKALKELLAENVNRARILRSLQKPQEQRTRDFEEYAAGSETRMEVLQNLSNVYDKREKLQQQRNVLTDTLKGPEEAIKQAGLDLEEIKVRLGDWMKLNDEALKKQLTDFLGSEEHLDIVTKYVNLYSEWAKVVEGLTAPEEGLNVRFREAKRELDNLNLTAAQVRYIFEMPEGSTQRRQAVEKLKSQFSDRVEKIDKVVKAYDAYRPFRGRLDDPKDLQRILKGAGVLEFRILPMQNELESEKISRYVRDLQEKGPEFASDEDYIWCQIEDYRQWSIPGSITARFGDNYYVLASNKENEKLLHGGGKETRWALKRAFATSDRMGRRAIGFTLNTRGAKRFYNLTNKNLKRPLCILLDKLAISAPVIQNAISSRGEITGSFSRTEVADMVNKLSAGSLPARLIEQPISIKTIGPSIGADNRNKGIKAGFIGLMMVVGGIAIYYTLAGTIADVALLLNILFVLSSMALLRATFTLPGIAGIILTIGMSVDANVLIFERIREEQQRGASLRIAIRNGYQRAFRAIFDANLTTFITAAILYWRASEEVKGFAIVLMLGIASSMFTALFVTRVIFDILLSRRLIKEKLVMLRLIHRPNVNWMGARPVFFCISALFIAGGLFVFFTRNDAENNKYDIEFTGGTSVQINLKDEVNLTRQQVEDKIRAKGAELELAGMKAANVYSIGRPKQNPGGASIYDQYAITTTETNITRTIIGLKQQNDYTADDVAGAIEKAQAQTRGTLSNLRVSKAEGGTKSFEILTSQLNPSIVKNVLSRAFPRAEISTPKLDKIVNESILTAFEGQLEIRQNLQPEIVSEQKIADKVIEQYPELAEFIGGVKITCKLDTAVTTDELYSRMADLQFKPGMRDLRWFSHNYKFLKTESLEEAQPAESLKSFVYVNAQPEAGLRQPTDKEWDQLINNERRKILAATETETSLPRVTQIDPSVGAEAKTRALIAIFLSLFAIIAYVWVRFGNVRFGLAAITALVHDVCITLGAVTACTYVAGTVIGQGLLIGDFKIDLAIIAAFLTLIGYSLNDTIVVFDRIRENRKKGKLNPQIITDSINQTISRTLLTSLTTFAVVLIMYIFGGQGLRGFTFAIGFGIIIGTYSSIAIAAPVLLLGGETTKEKR